MNPLKIFRNSFLIVLTSLFFLVFSCSQYDLKEERAFTYAIYKSYLSSDLKIHLPTYTEYSSRISSGGMSLNEIKAILNQTNEDMGTSLTVPDRILNAMISIDNPDNLENFLINENLLTSSSVSHIETFVDEINLSTFDESIEKYEEVVTASDISEAEFIHADNTASTLKIINEEQPDTFVNDGNSLKISEASGKGYCILMYVMWVASLILLIGGCATVFLCVLSFALFTAQTFRTAEACAGYM